MSSIPLRARLRAVLGAAAGSTAGRIALSPMWSVYMTATGRPCLVTYRQGRWEHRHLGGTRLVAPSPGGRSPAQNHAETKDIYMWGFDLSDGGTVIDLGAGLGTEVATFQSAVGARGRVVAVEAHPGTFRHLVENIRLNRWVSVEAVHAAVGEADGAVDISDDVERHIGNSTVLTGPKAVRVPALTLDTLVDQRGIGAVDLLKMNIEGAEVGVLKGAERSLAQVRQIYVSCHDFRAERTGEEEMRTRASVIELLADSGFSLSYRLSDSRPWVRDAVYGRRRGSEGSS